MNDLAIKWTSASSNWCLPPFSNKISSHAPTPQIRAKLASAQWGNARVANLNCSRERMVSGLSISPEGNWIRTSPWVNFVTRGRSKAESIHLDSDNPKLRAYVDETSLRWEIFSLPNLWNLEEKKEIFSFPISNFYRLELVLCGFVTNGERIQKSRLGSG